MPDDTIPRDQSRAALNNLPRRNPSHIWDGPGNGETCPVCRLPVTKQQNELVIQFASDRDPGLDTFHVHSPCFVIWADERERRYWS